HLCCGRPLYDYGMLDLARRYLDRVLAALRDDLRAGVHVVGLEPSCVAVFKDEARQLLPDDEDARRLVAQTHHFAGFLAGADWEPPPLARRVLVHGHCHHKATGGLEPEHELLRRLGADVRPLQTGCCGMAGSFGFEQGKYEISMKIAEQSFLPEL